MQLSSDAMLYMGTNSFTVLVLFHKKKQFSLQLKKVIHVYTTVNYILKNMNKMLFEKNQIIKNEMNRALGHLCAHTVSSPSTCESQYCGEPP